MTKIALIACWISMLSYGCSDVADEASQDDDAPTSQSAQSVSLQSCSIDSPPPQVAFFASTETACTKCIISHRPDLIPFYKSNNWRTGTKNRNCIIENWCSIDPVGCGLVRARDCTTSVCNQPLAPNLVARIAGTLNDSAEWAAFNANPDNHYWDPIANGKQPCQSFVSMIWYLAGFKPMGPGKTSDSVSTEWYVHTGGASTPWAGVDEFWATITGPRPDLAAPPVTMGTPQVAGFEQSLRVGDVIDYFGTRAGTPDVACPQPCWKHSVIVTRDGSGGGKPQVASMGTPHTPGVAWDAIHTDPPDLPFDYTKVRAIHAPAQPLN